MTSASHTRRRRLRTPRRTPSTRCGRRAARWPEAACVIVARMRRRSRPRKRPLMGAAAARGADEVILTTTIPRSEDPLVILEAAAAEHARAIAGGARPPCTWCRTGPWRSPRRWPPAGGDAVVVAGKGHEQGQELAGVVHPFDDAAVLRTAIERIRASAGRCERSVIRMTLPRSPRRSAAPSPRARTARSPSPGRSPSIPGARTRRLVRGLRRGAGGRARLRRGRRGAGRRGGAGEPDVGVPAVLVADVQDALGRLARAALKPAAGHDRDRLTGSSGKTRQGHARQVLAAHGTHDRAEGSFKHEIGLR